MKIYDQPVKRNKRTYYNIRKTETGQGDDYTTGCLLNYPYVKDFYKMIAIDLSEQQALDANPKSIQQSNFTGSLNQRWGAKIFFIIKEAKETVLNFLQGTVRVL